MKFNILKLLVLMFIASFTFAQNTSEEKKTDFTKIKSEIVNQNNESIKNEFIANHKKLDEVIKNIKNESYLKFFDNEKELNRTIYFLRDIIDLNTKQGNTLAIQRDKLKLITLQEQLLYQHTLKDIIIAKRQYRSKKYFQNILNVAIKKIKEDSIESFTSLYEKEKKSSNPVAIAFKKNYKELYEQQFTYFFILRNLLEDIPKFRSENFLIDRFGIKYFVDKINNTKGVESISLITRHYLGFSVGKLFMVLAICLFFILIRNKIVSLISKIFIFILIRQNQENHDDLAISLKNSLKKPLIFVVYFIILNVSLNILIDDENFIAQISPWWDTIFVSLLAWIVYILLDNSIDIYAHNVLKKYSNVRKEIIVFILKFVKIILIVLVLAFLLTQLGLDIRTIIASLGVGGIAVALASKETLENLFASITIMTDDSFAQGDWIQTSEVDGTVVDIRMRTTRIRTFGNAMITVPNASLANKYIMNWSKRKIGRRIKMSIGISYECNMKDIIKLKDDIHDMLASHEGIAKEEIIGAEGSRRERFKEANRADIDGVKNTLLVFIDAYADWSINILVYCFSKDPDWEKWLTVKQDVIVKIEELVKKNNCEFAYPSENLWIKNKTVV